MEPAKQTATPQKQPEGKEALVSSLLSHYSEKPREEQINNTADLFQREKEWCNTTSTDVNSPL